MKSVFTLTVESQIDGTNKCTVDFQGDIRQIEFGMTQAVRDNVEFRVFLVQILLNSIGDRIPQSPIVVPEKGLKV